MNEPEGTSSLASEAYNVVRQRILRGTLVLGQVISRRKLAAELGMSFMPVSEALLRLEFEGLLESRPRAGTRVRIPSLEDVQGHYVVREALEVQAAQLYTTVAAPADRFALRKLAERVDALALKTDRVPYLALHQKLHRRIAECTRCAALCEAIDKTYALASIWFCALRQPPFAGYPPNRHQDFIDVLNVVDAMQAAEAVRQHLAVGRQRTIDVLQPYFRIRRANGRTFYRSERKRTQPVERSNFN